jgi:peptidoglycan hydrolase CwlO-like protein
MKKPLKPKVLGDIVPRSAENVWDTFHGVSKRINLSPRRRYGDFPLIRIAKAGVILAAAIFLVFGSASAPTVFTKASGDTSTSTDPTIQRQALETQLQQLEGQINQYEGQITTYEKQGSTLTSQINALNAQVAKINLQIQATNLTLQELDNEIASTQSQITVTQSDIAEKKASLANLLQSLYQNDQQSLLQAFLKNPQLSDFWNESQNIVLIQSNLRVNVQQITDLMGQLQNQEQEFAASRSDQASIAAYQESQAEQIASAKSEKNQLLAQTKGQESKYQALLVQTKMTAAQIRNQIFQLLGGGQLSFGDAYQFAKLASGATNVPPELILAVLDRESALGQNVGRCSYQTAMSPSNIPIFLQITQQLGLDPNEIMVSCANSDGAYGGAMGPAQFEPSTWELYAPGITKITGDNPASPWKNADAFVATGLYLKDAMQGCVGLYSSQVSQERCTAAKYYAGSRWKNYLWTYGEAVVEQAQTFSQDIAELDASGS